MLFGLPFLAGLSEMGISPHASHAERMATRIAKRNERKARAPAALSAAEAKRRRKAAKMSREIAPI